MSRWWAVSEDNTPQLASYGIAPADAGIAVSFGGGGLADGGLQTALDTASQVP